MAARLAGGQGRVSSFMKALDLFFGSSICSMSALKPPVAGDTGTVLRDRCFPLTPSAELQAAGAGRNPRKV